MFPSHLPAPDKVVVVVWPAECVPAPPIFVQGSCLRTLSSLPLSPRQLKLKFDQTNNIFDTCLLRAHGSRLGKKYLDTQFGTNTTNVVTVISPHQAQSSGPAPAWLVVIEIL